MKKLLRDVMALWYRYELLSQLERKNGAYNGILGIRSFFEAWLKKEMVGYEQSEFDRIKQNTAVFLENSEKLHVSTRLMVFNLLGNVWGLLGGVEYSQEKLLNYAEEIKTRMELPYVSFAEILLNLYVLHTLGGGIDKVANLDYYDLLKAIRHWSSKEEFYELLFKSWNVYWENDYFSKLDGDDKELLEQNPNLLYNLPVRLDLGDSFVDFLDFKTNESSLTSLFNPAPIFMFGGSGSGKSTLLTAFCYEAEKPLNQSVELGARRIALGRELLAHYQNNVSNWHKGEMPPTSGYQDYTFWEDLDIKSFRITDYGGSDTQPDQWDSQLQELFKNARALLFFLDPSDYTDVYALRKKSQIFNSFLDSWINSNPSVRHLPIAVILTKCDQSLAGALNELQSTTVIPKDFKPAAIETMFPHRMTAKNDANLTVPYGRFRDCILNYKKNNENPVLQDIIHLLLDNFEQFFRRVIEVTYNYQIFITSAAAPIDSSDKLLPFGVREPFTWTIRHLERTYITETMGKYDGEKGEIHKKKDKMKDDIKKMYKLHDELEKTESELHEWRTTKKLHKIVVAPLRLKSLEENFTKYDQTLKKMIRHYNPEVETDDRLDKIRAIEDSLKKMDETVLQLHDKRRKLENRKKELKIE